MYENSGPGRMDAWRHAGFNVLSIIAAPQDEIPRHPWLTCMHSILPVGD